MKTRELTKSELEMLGLQQGTITTNNEPAKPHVVINNKELEKFVGEFVEYDGHLGMIDAVHGNRLGFVWSDKDSWTGELADASKVEICTGERVERAARSALTYFNRETTSLRSRIARNYACDCKEDLNRMLTHAATWQHKLTAK